ncbi:eukaryotic translation initiation factor 2-alpha kinase [Plasmodium gonderi]|uniref:Eukaryotic translation initiation factor 2-alpha kinase PK4 n=1 Tax=Plasmodium gonderi TaxID=77519 RepID=A0A1Y1JGU0_PLAGO|nr:eukaryotic translation initiation factor 2-alpha kinase [Plasmodium gonderi]GAW81749.1 eukaryotic translation initiation factor 2-alpha kinase [Plasmodium gonderi]
MSYYNYLKKKIDLNNDDKYDNVEMAQSENYKKFAYPCEICKHGNRNTLNDLHDVNTKRIRKNRSLTIEGKRRNKFRGRNVQNYAFKNEMNEVILSNLKNIFEKMSSIEQLTNMGNYINMKNNTKKFDHVNLKSRSSRTIHLSKKNRSRSEVKLCIPISSNRMDISLYNNKLNNDMFKSVYELSSDNYYRASSDSEYYPKNNAYNSNSCNYNLHGSDDNLCYFSSAYDQISLKGSNRETHHWDDKIENWEEIKSEYTDCLPYSPIHGNSTSLKYRTIFKRILKEENGRDAFKQNVSDGEKKDSYEDIIISKQDNIDLSHGTGIHGKFQIFDLFEMKHSSESEKKENSVICKKDEENTLLNNQMNLINSEENVRTENDIIVVKDEELNSPRNMFQDSNNLGNKNLLFQYEPNKSINMNDINLARYYRDKYFHGQYKYDESIFIYDLIVLDISGYIYKVSTDGTYYWKYKVVNNIQDYVSFGESKKRKEYYKSIKNEPRLDPSFKDILAKNECNKNDKLKLKAMKKLYPSNIFDLNKINSSKNVELNNNEKMIKNCTMGRGKKHAYNDLDDNEKLEKNNKGTKRLLASYSGDLFYINENNKAMALNINIKDVVNNSPFKSPLFPNIVFMGSRHSSIINLDYDTGDLIKKYDESLEDLLLKKEKKTIPHKNIKFLKNASTRKRDEFLLENEFVGEWSDADISTNQKGENEDQDSQDEDERIYSDDDNSGKYGHNNDDNVDSGDNGNNVYNDDNGDHYNSSTNNHAIKRGFILDEHSTNENDGLPGEHEDNIIKHEEIIEKEQNNNSIINIKHERRRNKPFWSDEEIRTLADSGHVLNDYLVQNEYYKYTPKNKYTLVSNYNEKTNNEKRKYNLNVLQKNVRERKNVLFKKLFTSLNRMNSLNKRSENSNILDITRMRRIDPQKKRKKKKWKKRTEKKQLQISIIKWIIKAVDENSLKKKWITTWVDVGSIFITDSHKQDVSFINSLIELVGNKLILRPLEIDKMGKLYNITKNINTEPEEEIDFMQKNYDEGVGSDERSNLGRDLRNDKRKIVGNSAKKPLNQESSNVKSKIFIFSEVVSSVFALRYKHTSNIFTLDLIMKQNSKMFPDYENVQGFNYNSLNFKKDNALLLPFSSSEFVKHSDEKTSCNFDENINYGKKLLHRINNISVSITSIEKDIRHLLSNIIFIFDRNKKIPINYIYKMKSLIRKYQKTKEQFLFYLPGVNNRKHLSYSYYNDTYGKQIYGGGRYIGGYNGNYGGNYSGKNGAGWGYGGPIHICEYINKFIDMYFEENEICFDYCSMLNIWDKIFNNYVSQDDCLLLSNLYRVVQNAFAFNNRDFNHLNDGEYMLSDNANFLIKRRKKAFGYSTGQDLKEVSTLKYKKGWYWNIFYAMMLIFVVPFVFVYRMFRKKKSNDNNSSKAIMKNKKLKDYDDEYRNDQDFLNIKNRLLRDDHVKLKNLIVEKDYVDLSQIELDMNIKREILKKLKELKQQPTLIDILAKHARDSDSDSKFYDINEGKYNLNSPNYWDGSSKYSLPNMSITNLSRTKSGEASQADTIGTNMFYMYRRRAASQDVIKKKSFIVKNRIRSSYKLGNRYYKKNYTDNEKDKKQNHLKDKHITEKDFDKSDFINFLTNFNKKFMKKNSLVDHLLKMSKTEVDTSKYSNPENSNSDKDYLSHSENLNKNEKNEGENVKDSGKKHAMRKYHNEENKIIEEKKNKNKYSKYVENNNGYVVNTLKQNNPIKNKLDNNGNNNEKINNKNASARNLSIIQRSHIPYDAPLADFLENGRFMRTFENISLIGQGGFGSVYKVSHRLEPGSPTYAVKFIYLKVSSLDNVSSRRYFREIAANRDIYSKHVVRYYTWWCEEPQFLPMHVMPKEIQNLVKKNKDSFKKMYNKSKKNDGPIDYEKLSSWENNNRDLKNFKKVIKKKNERSLTFYSDNDGLNSRKNDNTKKKRFLSDKNFSDNIYTNANTKNKIKKKKKKKKIIYKEKQNVNRKTRNQNYLIPNDKINPSSINSSFQEYDPFDCGYLSEEDRDLIVFADNDEPNICNEQQIRMENDDRKKKTQDNNSETYSATNNLKNDNDIQSNKCQTDTTSNWKGNENVTYGDDIGRDRNDAENKEKKEQSHLMPISHIETNIQCSNVNDDTSIKRVSEGVEAGEKKAHITNSNKQHEGLMDNKKIIREDERSQKKMKNWKEEGSQSMDEKQSVDSKREEKEEINYKNKEKIKNVEELGFKENVDRIRTYKKKNMAPEFSIVLLLQMELCKGYTLRKWLDRSTRSDKPLHFTYRDKNMNHPLEFDLFKQLIKGLKDIHSTCFIHRDLKPENIFVDPDTYTLKIGDLGLVRFIEEKKREKDLNTIDAFKDNIYTDINQNTITSQISLKGQIIGTPGYTAPEGGALCDEKADIYSAALILLELLCPRFNTIMERYKRLNDFRNYYAVPDYVKIHLNPWYILMLQMSKPNPADRPSAADLYSKIKVLLDPHLSDFAFSFNDINDDDVNYYPSVVRANPINVDGYDNDNNLNEIKTNSNGIVSKKKDKGHAVNSNLDDKCYSNKNADNRNDTSIGNNKERFVNGTNFE